MDTGRRQHFGGVAARWFDGTIGGGWSDQWRDIFGLCGTNACTDIEEGRYGGDRQFEFAQGSRREKGDRVGGSDVSLSSAVQS